MAKKSDKSAPASGPGRGMQSGTLAGEHANAAEAPPDPFAGKSEAGRQPILEAARKADEAARPGRASLVVDADKKAKALALLGKLGALDAKVQGARAAGNSVDDIQKVRVERKAVKAQYSKLYGEAPDSCQAAETEMAAS